MPRARPRKRPCKICRRWFLPNNRLKDRQKTCGDPECQHEWHLRKCREWNRQNKKLSRANTLQTKLDNALAGCSSPTRIDIGLPEEMVQELIDIPTFVVIQHLAQFILRKTYREIRATALSNSRGP